MVVMFMKKIINKIAFLLMIMVISGIFGFLYETAFYRIDLGYFVKRGTTFGPWIPIYAFGGLFIYFICRKINKNPFLVFLLSMIVCGLLEFITGYFLFKLENIRLWDYNTEILNFGNIGGFICLRSILFFAFSGLLLMYVVIPLINKFKSKLGVKFNYLGITLGIIFLLDFFISDIV